ncbi:MAG TPA: hypothetical protein VIU61_18855 [Kofleriaceae bacterium]
MRVAGEQAGRADRTGDPAGPEAIAVRARVELAVVLGREMQSPQRAARRQGRDRKRHAQHRASGRQLEPGLEGSHRGRAGGLVEDPGHAAKARGLLGADQLVEIGDQR